LHYWKFASSILYSQKRLGWGGQVIEKISIAIREKYTEKKGDSPRNLKYLFQLARLYTLEILQKLLLNRKEMEIPTIEKVISATKVLDKYEIRQEPPAQIQTSN
jgi:hypothetical protein